MQISDNGLKLLAEFEGNVLHMYKDDAGHPTIGIGHKLLNSELVGGYVIINGEHVDWRKGITSELSDALCRQDLQRFEKAVNDGVRVNLTQNQYDALVIFCFNIGDGGFKASTALRVINAKEFDKVPDAMRMWNKTGGVVNQGLVNRREKEIKLWES